MKLDGLDTLGQLRHDGLNEKKVKRRLFTPCRRNALGRKTFISKKLVANLQMTNLDPVKTGQ